MDDKILNIYMEEAVRSQPLTAEEEKTLSDKIKNGDRRALNKLVEANLRFVVKIASQYRSEASQGGHGDGAKMSIEDMISEGNIGLIEAAGKFDADRGVPFVKYAVTFIRRNIEKAIDRQQAQYRIPKDADQQARQAGRAVSVDAPLGRRSNMSLLSVLVNSDAPMADERVYDETVESAVEFAIDALPKRERIVLNAFFGIGQEHETLAETADRLGLKRERVRQIRNRAVRRLRKLYKHKLAELRK